MRGEELISYFYTEIIKIKYPHVFKEFSLPENTYPTDEEAYDNAEINFMLKKTAERVNKEVKQTFLMKLQSHPLYYEYCIIFAIAIVVFLFLIKYL
jgi:hypothetical protein